MVPEEVHNIRLLWSSPTALPRPCVTAPSSRWLSSSNFWNIGSIRRFVRNSGYSRTHIPNTSIWALGLLSLHFTPRLPPISGLMRNSTLRSGLIARLIQVFPIVVASSLALSNKTSTCCLRASARTCSTPFRVSSRCSTFPRSLDRQAADYR